MNYNLIEEWKKYDTDEYLYHRYFHQYLLHPYEKPKGEEYVTLISLIKLLNDKRVNSISIHSLFFSFF